MKLKLIIKYILVILWMILIFGFSNQTGEISTNTSDGFVYQVINLFEEISEINIDDSIIEILVFPIRKLAHFSIYFILGFLWMVLLKEYSISLREQVILAIMLCFIYASSDEIHQLFVPGRSGRFLDVLIDTLGSLCSVVIVYILTKRKKLRGISV